jgi:hypothetical protein
VPERVVSTGVEENGAQTNQSTQNNYGSGGPAISCCSGALCQAGRPFVHGFEIYLERATLTFESGTCPLTLLDAAGNSRQVKLKGGGDPVTAFTSEIQAAVDGVVAGEEPDLLSGKLARDALVLCHKECQSVRSAKAVAVRTE